MVSAIYDRYRPLIPEVERHPYDQTFYVPAIQPSTTSLEEFRKLIADFRADVVNAKEADAKAGEPDCLDPEKAKLEDRVRELEAIIAKPPEFVIVKGGNVKPGRYRVLDGMLYKAVE